MKLGSSLMRFGYVKYLSFNALGVSSLNNNIFQQC